MEAGKMFINVEGYRTQNKRLVKLLEDSAEFYGRSLMRKDLCHNVGLDIVLYKDMDRAYGTKDILGWCGILDDNMSRPREFQIDLCTRQGTTRMLMTLAHEMVHLSQFAQGRLRHLNDGSTMWNKKKLHRAKGEKLKYKNLPWEEEAFSKEGDLFVELVNTTNIMDEYVDGITTL
jgi:hypothetical protein